ncbi:MAG: membrane protein insertase YidC [Wenzhouxiangella sp.]|nr:MAG: membrane protein insertase YidC [Wenzhouxiangella sp.]
MNTRVFFILMLGIIGFFLFMEWQREYVAPPQPSQPAAPMAFDDPDRDVPSAADLPDLPDIPDLADRPARTADVPAPAAEIRASRRIEVSTDVLQVEIDANGGAIVDLRLKDFPVAVDRPDEPFTLLIEQLPEVFVAQAGLLSAEHPAPNHRSRWETNQTRFELAPGSDRLEVPLFWRDEASDLEVIATWIFHRGDYVIDLDIEVRNQGSSEWRGSRYVQLQRTEPDHSDSGWAFTNPERFSYTGAAIFSPEEKLQKRGFSDIRSRDFQATITGGWAAMIQHYFLAAWIPPEEQAHRFSTRFVDTDRLPRYVVAAASPQVTVPAGESYRFTARLYAGPKLQNRLNEIADGLVLTVDYRWFRILSQPLFWVLDKIHSVFGHWGWSIVVLTLLIKLVFYKLTEAQFRSMGKLRKLQPRIQALKERYGDDRQKFGQAMMDIYKKEKVNPLGGCLPILVQIPIFISLYWVLLESVELRQTSFLWVPDLSRPDPLFILPILNGIFMIITQRLMPTAGMDPMQRKIMMWLPVIFAFLFALFPAGLVLYWATNAGVSLAQQWYILRRLDQEELKRKN